MNHPSYFVAVFGDPGPNKDAVESGVYMADSKYAPFPIVPGDVLLLYCTENYPAHSKQVPGYGVALKVDRERVEYRWQPFVNPIPKRTLDRMFDPEDAKRFGSIRFSSHWLFKISKESFTKTVSGRKIL